MMMFLLTAKALEWARRAAAVRRNGGGVGG